MEQPAETPTQEPEATPTPEPEATTPEPTPEDAPETPNAETVEAEDKWLADNPEDGEPTATATKAPETQQATAAPATPAPTPQPATPALSDDDQKLIGRFKLDADDLPSKPERRAAFLTNLRERADYTDLGGDYYLRRNNPDRSRDHHIQELQNLGYRVTLDKVA